MYTYLSRFFFLLHRISISIDKIGFINTFKIFFLSKLKKNIMYLKLSNKKFYFRPIVDHGNYSRFTFPQYTIIDDSNNRIEYIIDGGSNIGSQSIRFINKYSSTLKKIICVEPSYDNFKSWFLPIWDNKDKILDNINIVNDSNIYTIVKSKLKSSEYILLVFIVSLFLYLLNCNPKYILYSFIITYLIAFVKK